MAADEEYKDHAQYSEALSDEDIRELAKKLCPDLRACVPKDLLPKELQKGYYVINLQSLNQGNRQGTHWTSFAYTADNEIFYFDSYGGPPPLEVEQYRIDPGVHLVFNSKDYQAFGSSLCGWYDLYFLHLMYLHDDNYPVVTRIWQLKSGPGHLENNEKIIRAFYEKWRDK